MRSPWLALTAVPVRGSHGSLPPHPRRFRRWLLRNGLLRLEADEASNETPELSALDACTRASVGIGQLTHVESDGGHEDDAADELQGLRPRKGGGRYFGEAMGFGLHAGVCVPAGNAFGRELLLRYCARPPFALERLSLLPDGRIAYRLKKPWRPDQTHRVMTPTQLLARLSALIPPPRSPLIRFHGVFAPNFPRRDEVVPTGASPSPHSTGCVKASGVPRQDGSTKPVQAETAPTIVGPDNKDAPSVDSSDAAGSRSSPGAPTPAAVNRVPSPPGYSSAPWRIDWATLLHRVYDVDALACVCGGRLEFVDLVVRPSWARTILERLGLQTETPVVLQARTVDLEPVEPPRRDWDP